MKPSNPATNLAVIGIYMYDPSVFEVITKLRPSGRGELEITDVNNAFIDAGSMTYDVLHGWWADAGASIDGYLDSNNLVRHSGANKMSVLSHQSSVVSESSVISPDFPTFAAAPHSCLRETDS